MVKTSPRDSSPVRSRPLFENNWREVRYACRSLARSPGFTVPAILMLALGIGVAASVFSVAEPLLSRPLPVRDPGSLVIFRSANLARAESVDRVPDELFHRLTAGSTTLSGVFGFLPLPGVRESLLETDTVRDRVQVDMVTGTYFSVLGVDAAVGRGLAKADDEASAPDVMVISHRLWQKDFNGDPDVVGRTIRFAQPNGGIGRSGVIVGVAPPGFHGVDVDSDSDVWVPFRVVNRDRVRLGGEDGVRVMGRVQEGVSLAAVQTEVDILSSELTDRELGALRGGRFSVLAESGGRGYSQLRYQFVEPVWALSAAVGVVLLIVWTNLAALMLGRGAFRSREIAIRLALGSDRRSLLGLFLREGLILALAGGGLGFIVAVWGTAFLTSWLPPETILVSRMQPGWRTLPLIGGVSMLGMIFFAFLPGVKWANMSVVLPVGGSAAGGRAVLPGHRVAIVVQIALSLSLLIGAGLFLRTLGNLRDVDAGFDDEQTVLQFEIEAPSSRRLMEFGDTGLARLGSLPGVRSTTHYYAMPGQLQEGESALLSSSPGGSAISARPASVGPRFFETLGIALVSGRTLSGELTGGAAVLDEDVYYIDRGDMVLSENLAARLFEGDDPIGHRVFRDFMFRNPENPEFPVFETWTVVGVVRDIRYLDLRDPSDLTSYTFAPVPQHFVIQTESDAAAFAPVIRRVVEEFDPEFRIANARTLAQVRRDSLAPERFVAEIATLFALASLALAAIGIYGVFSYSARLRRVELAVRMALGARPRTVIAMFMLDNLRVVGPGIVLGLLAAFATTRFLTSMLFGVVPMDPSSVISATLILTMTAAFAAYLPARRSSRLDPMVVLRDE